MSDETLSSKIHKNVILEIRPRLQSVNVLIALTPSTTSRIIKVILNSVSFDLIVDGEISTISCGSLSVVPNSLTSLIITETSVTFRFATQANFDDWGSFKTELLQISKDKTVSNNITTVPIEKNIDYDILCGNCRQNVCNKSVKFERVLPLPSEGSEPGDWFCHCHNNGNGASSVTSVNLNPKISDIFYTHCYFHLHLESVENVRNSDGIIVCKRCLTWLGLAHNRDTVKLWFNTVRFKNIDNSYSHSTTPLSDTLISCKSILSNNLFNSVKLLLYCRTSRNQSDYILLWALEKQLNIHIHDEGSNVRDCKVAKVLFRYENGCSDIAKTWEDDSSVTLLTVSKPMIVEVLKDLYKYNAIFPKQYSQSNNFYISYLTMYD